MIFSEHELLVRGMYSYAAQGYVYMIPSGNRTFIPKKDGADTQNGIDEPGSSRQNPLTDNAAYESYESESNTFRATVTYPRH